MQSSFLVAAWEVEEVAQPCGRHSAFNGKPLRHVKVNSKYRTYLSAQITPDLLRLSLVSGLNSGRTHWVARLSQLGDSINVGLPGARVAALVGRQRYCWEYIWGGDAFVTIKITFVTDETEASPKAWWRMNKYALSAKMDLIVWPTWNFCENLDRVMTRLVARYVCYTKAGNRIDIIERS